MFSARSHSRKPPRRRSPRRRSGRPRLARVDHARDALHHGGEVGHGALDVGERPPHVERQALEPLRFEPVVDLEVHDRLGCRGVLDGADRADPPLRIALDPDDRVQ